MKQKKISFKLNSLKKENVNVYGFKPVFKDYYKKIYNFLKKNKYMNVIDVGCANGAFTFFAPKNLNIIGIDIDKRVLKNAKKLNKRFVKSFYCINLFKKNSTIAKNFIKQNKSKFDVITMFGTFHLFRNYSSVIKVLCSLKPKAIILTTMINDGSEVAILTKNDNSLKWENFFNFFSKKEISKEFKKNGYKTEFIDYEMRTFLKKNKSQFDRNYHLLLKNNKKILVNDYGLFFKEKLVIAKK